MLLTLFLLPLVGSLMIATMSDTTAADLSRIKKTALAVTLITFVLSMVMWSEFDSNYSGQEGSSSQYQFVTELTNTSFFSLRFGVDGLSLFFVLLTTFTLPFCILASWENVRHSLKAYMIAFLVFEAFTIAVFVVLDVIAFYVSFEAVLIPLFLIVGIWGASEARIRASFLLFLYTLFGSLFMLLAFVAMYYTVGSTDFEVLTAADLSFDTQKILWLAIFLSFAIKTPLVPFHIWLSRAHVEAPVAGSMVLAGLVLKLATYGILRVLLPILPEASAYFAPLALTMGVISIVYASLTALRQTDFKCLVAMSSVAHMGVVILGLFSNTVQGIEGAILLSLAHGFVSPALFFLVGAVIYDRFHSRVIRYYRGLTMYMPVFSALFFFFTVANMGTPGFSVNWVGEFMCLAGTFQLNPLAGLLGASSIVLGACYSIWLYNRIAFGSYSPYLTWTTDLTRREFIVLLTMAIPTLLFALFPNIILVDLHYAVSTLLYTHSTPLSGLVMASVGVSAKTKFSKEDLQQYFKAMLATDDGGPTNNVNILATRFMQSGQAVTKEILNQVLGLEGNQMITDDLFTYITTISASATFEYPITPGQRVDWRKFAGTVGQDNSDLRRIGAYNITDNLTGDNYIGGALNIATRSSMHTRPTTDTTMAKYYQAQVALLGKENVSFSIQAYSYPLTLPLVCAGYTPETLAMSLEQYLFFTLGYTINSNPVANMGTHTLTSAQLEAKWAAEGKPVLMYQLINGIAQLVHTFPSIGSVGPVLGLSYQWGFHVVAAGNQGKYWKDRYLFSTTPVDGAVVAEPSLTLQALSLAVQNLTGRALTSEQQAKIVALNSQPVTSVNITTGEVTSYIDKNQAKNAVHADIQVLNKKIHEASDLVNGFITTLTEFKDCVWFYTSPDSTINQKAIDFIIQFPRDSIVYTIMPTSTAITVTRIADDLSKTYTSLRNAQKSIPSDFGVKISRDVLKNMLEGKNTYNKYVTGQYKVTSANS